MDKQGYPEHLRSDNGPEFIAYAMQDWLKVKNIQTAYIRPGSPWEQCYVESFHDKLRDELLNREVFHNLQEAKVLLEGPPTQLVLPFNLRLLFRVQSQIERFFGLTR